RFARPGTDGVDCLGALADLEPRHSAGGSSRTLWRAPVRSPVRWAGGAARPDGTPACREGSTGRRPPPRRGGRPRVELCVSRGRKQVVRRSATGYGPGSELELPRTGDHAHPTGTERHPAVVPHAPVDARDYLEDVGMTRPDVAV